MAQLPVPFAQYSDPRACATAPAPIDDSDVWTPASLGAERRHSVQVRGKPRNGRPPLERLREAFVSHGATPHIARATDASCRRKPWACPKP